ncbi:hypothetical protein [Botrimarina hoheduenensis]|uniref:Uncharacterized protein n=1 Tax=Botrimarina hoheduenensis TaxID=2528000 RepID=A0A5C5W037_9BACT|nr:hypothetical protein [Botrimarina hoheduenensis]TWT43381.1 hypothetical protein Pla111_23320 [Botrimarina hoheduenensis]
MPPIQVAAMTLPCGDSSAADSASIFSIEDFRQATQSEQTASSVVAVVPPRPTAVGRPSVPFKRRHLEAGPLDRLLGEATSLARKLGVEVRRRWLAGAGGGSYWRSGMLRVVLDSESSSAAQLATLADALRGDHRLSSMPMSSALFEFLDVRRAA